MNRMTLMSCPAVLLAHPVPSRPGSGFASLDVSGGASRSRADPTHVCPSNVASVHRPEWTGPLSHSPTRDTSTQAPGITCRRVCFTNSKPVAGASTDGELQPTRSATAHVHSKQSKTGTPLPLPLPPFASATTETHQYRTRPKSIRSHPIRTTCPHFVPLPTQRKKFPFRLLCPRRTNWWGYRKEARGQQQFV